MSEVVRCGTASGFEPGLEMSAAELLDVSTDAVQIGLGIFMNRLQARQTTQHLSTLALQYSAVLPDTFRDRVL